MTGFCVLEKSCRLVIDIQDLEQDEELAPEDQGAYLWDKNSHELMFSEELVHEEAHGIEVNIKYLRSSDELIHEDAHGPVVNI